MRWVIPAGPAEVTAVSDLLAGAAAWLHRDKHLDQWPDRFPAERLMEAIDQQSTYLVVDHGTPVATVTLDESPDKEFWSRDECLEPALYVSKLAIDRRCRGLGAQVLDWAQEQAYKRDAQWLRLDAWKTNDGLRRYYVGQEFTHVRTMDLAHRRSGALFQREAAPKPTPLWLVGADQPRPELATATSALLASATPRPLVVDSSKVFDDR
ncbi:hypothetical protein GCM10009765_24530 [Fodinicola feengrottensis]|uniref:N-acetyltransferase domain-containing protein n=1 Tax=Fodinicola feengrottensis TaxID=435914 RepID=A0ABN2GNP5_9ACTN